jgi:hypothetical protein
MDVKLREPALGVPEALAASGPWPAAGDGTDGAEGLLTQDYRYNWGVTVNLRPSDWRRLGNGRRERRAEVLDDGLDVPPERLADAVGELVRRLGDVRYESIRDEGGVTIETRNAELTLDYSASTSKLGDAVFFVRWDDAESNDALMAAEALWQGLWNFAEALDLVVADRWGPVLERDWLRPHLGDVVERRRQADA